MAAERPNEPGQRKRKAPQSPHPDPSRRSAPPIALSGTALRAAESLCQGEDSALSRMMLRQLAVDAGHDAREVDGMGRDELCVLLGIFPTRFAGTSAFPSDLRLLGAARAMREITGYAEGGRALIVRDDPDEPDRIEITTLQLPASVEQGPPERPQHTETQQLPPLPEGFEPTGEPALYFSQSGDVSPGPLVLRVLHSMGGGGSPSAGPKRSRLAAACVAGFDGLVPESLVMYDSGRDPLYDDGRGAPDDAGLVCIFAGLIAPRGWQQQGMSAVEAVRRSARLCVINYVRGGNHPDRPRVSRYHVVLSSPDGTQKVIYSDGETPRASMAPDPNDPSVVRLVVSSGGYDDEDHGWAPGRSPPRLRVDCFLIRDGSSLEPEFGLSGGLIRFGARPFGHSPDDAAFVVRPAGNGGGPVLRATSIVRPRGSLQPQGVQDYRPPVDPDDDLDVTAGRGAVLADGSLPAGQVSLARVRVDNRVPNHIPMYQEMVMQEVNPLAGDLLLLSTVPDRLDAPVAAGAAPRRLFLTGGTGAAAEIPAPRAPGFVHGAVAASAQKNPAAVSSEDTYTIALASDDGSVYRVAVAGRVGDGGVVLRGYREFSFAHSGPHVSRFFGVIAFHGPDLDAHLAAAHRTRHGVAFARQALGGPGSDRSEGALHPAAAGAGARSAAAGAGAGSAAPAEGHGEEDRHISAALRRRLSRP